MIYNVLVEYSQFEDYSMNYSIIKGSFSTEKRAINFIEQCLLEELSCGMLYYGNNLKQLQKDWEYRKNRIMEDINTWSYLQLKQDIGLGEVNIILCKNEIDKEEL